MAKKALPYLMAAAAVLIATLLRVALRPMVGSSIPFVTYFVAALALAWYFGSGPAALSIALSAIAGGHFILNGGTGGLLPADRAGRAAVIGFALLSLSVSFLLDAQRRTLDRARSAERDQKQANLELERVNRDLEAFAYSASHDLREPLRTVALSADFLEQSLGPRLEGDDARFLGYMQTSARRMTALLDGLMEYATAGKWENRPVHPMETDGLVAEVLASLRASISGAGATVAAGKLPSVAMEETHLAQIFQNLVSNALRYGGKRIDISGEQRDGVCLFSVSDDGIGIAPEYSEQIFGLFKRLQSGHASEGRGIGLAICRRVVERYGGRIWLSKSQPGHGSTFCFSIPREISDKRDGSVGT